MEEKIVLSKPYQEEFIYSETGDKAYDLIMINKTNGYVIVVITALEEDAGISIANLYQKTATQVYSKHLQKIEINNIVWIERIIHQTKEEAFFEIDLIWDEKSKLFHSPQWKACDEEIIFSIKRHCAK
jgi:hypothetical protein